MARVTYVKKAQQRYATVPVLNEDGTPKVVPITKKATGEQRATRHGKPMTRQLTVRDTTKPLPMPTCERCGRTIQVGRPYKHVTPKTSAYGGSTRYRCGSCPTWQPWDLTNALWARVQQIQNEYSATVEPDDGEETARGYFEDAAQAVRDLASEKQEAADNLEAGFGHTTSQSEELADQASELEAWADEIEQAFDNLDYPDTEDYEDPEDYDEALAAWAYDANAALDEALSSSPF